jgi:hypothetical protein
VSESADKRSPEPSRDREAANAGRPTYEPPTVTDLGTFQELTQQQLKVSGSADFVSFRPSHV